MTDSKIPLTLLTGFLGAGKTTLLNHFLVGQVATDIAVIVNEFGETGIDHLLIEQADEGIIELSDGCLCCTIRGDLTDTLAGLIDRLQTGKIQRLHHVIIETTGLADPAPILQALIGHPVMLQAFHIHNVLTIVDSIHGMETLENHKESRHQAALANRIVLSKTDINPDDETINRLKQRLAHLNPAADIITVEEATAMGEVLFTGALFNPDQQSAGINRWLATEAEHSGHHHEHTRHLHDVNRHSDTIRAFSLTHNQPIPPGVFQAFIDLLQAKHGSRILRMKGLVETADKGDRPLVIHGVQGMFYPPARLARWPDGIRQTRLVIIADGLAAEDVQRLFDAFMNRPAPDTADRTALLANPLAIPGIKF
ncbi:MAG: Cobalamin synthesis protein [Candidatus Tokpelaia hoelldobleri]|uniref:Cobalamin synthesis protein n=1 Tax=Candidatus Tokpelaia hoelldobleri TaxID=1902579 RepID=A0A1U9JSC7_9HYPH|nr:MAG: Cobalamin synthesis protein [Candidatus Tokpelaia hoelldoblerii]